MVRPLPALQQLAGSHGPDQGRLEQALQVALQASVNALHTSHVYDLARGSINPLYTVTAQIMQSTCVTLWACAMVQA